MARTTRPKAAKPTRRRRTGDAEATGTPAEDDPISATAPEETAPDAAGDDDLPPSEVDAQPAAGPGAEPHPGADGTSEADAPQSSDSSAARVGEADPAAGGDISDRDQDLGEPDRAGTSEVEARPGIDTGTEPQPSAEGTSEADAPSTGGGEEAVAAQGAGGEGTDMAENATEPDPAGASEVEARPDVDAPPDPAPEAQGASVVEASPNPEPQVVEKVTVQKGGFGAALGGGAVAALLGGLVGWLLWGQQDEAIDPNVIDEQAARISDLESQLEALPVSPDPDAIAETAAASLSPRIDELGAGLTSVQQAIATLDERIGALERAPNEDGTLSQDAIAAWEEEIGGLRDQVSAQADRIASQDDRIQALADDVTATREAQAAQAAALEEDASAAEQIAARGALARIQAALETGGSYAEPLDEYARISGAEVPPELAEPAEDGVPSLSDLRESYPEAARAALQAAREQGIGEEEEAGLGSLFRSTLQVRSTEPREGSSPDAILSRAEAALSDGRLGDALAEIASLPEEVRAAMADWISAAETRQAAVAAADALATDNIEN